MRNTIRRRPFAFLATAFLAGLPILPATAADLILGETASNETVTYNRDTRAFDNVYIGIDPSYTNNKLILTGTSGMSATVNVQTSGEGSVVVGALGNGNQMEIRQGAELNSNKGSIGAGYYSGSGSASNNNTVLVTGSNSTWNIVGALHIGGFYDDDSGMSSGSGNSLTISSGGQVNSSDLFTNFNNESGVSSNNTITVNGTNSLLKVTDNMFIGDSWDGGSLTISNGGRVESLFTRFGDNGGNLTATITGANSTWEINDGYLVIGSKASSDNNIVKVLNGGNITVSGGGELPPTVEVGAAGSNNLLEISGANSIFDATDEVYVGGEYSSSSNNTIQVKDGGDFKAYGVFIGQNAGSSNNIVLVTGANSTWLSDKLDVGVEGTFNSMNVTAGASVVAGQEARVGAGLGSDNTLTVSGNGSSFTAGIFGVGAGGGDRNQVIVQDGAHLNVMFSSAVGQSTGSQDNSVLVTGAGSQWLITLGNLDIGLDNGSPYVGTGQVTVENGGSVSVNGATTVTYTGSKLGGNGNFTSLGGTTVTGGAAFAPTGTSALNVTGDLTFSNGGNYLWNLFANSANASNAGTDFSAASTLSGGNLSVSSSNFTVNIGGTVDSTNNFWKQGHVWTVMTGSAFNLAAGENFTLALSGNSTGFTPDYFSLRSTETALELVYIAPYIWKDPVTDNWTDPTKWDSNLVPDATTLAFIDNDGTSQLATTGNVSTLYVGKSNSGSGLEVNAGGNLTVATALIIGDAAASDNNSATVNGTGATLTSPTITVGNFGSNNSLTVSNGGDVSTTSTIYLGAQSGSSDNTITVTGADSQLSGDIVVGANSGSGDVDSDNNKIVVSSGGSITSSSLTLGSSASSANNSLTVNGSGSTFAATGNITVGGAGDGNSLSVLNGGSASATNFVTLGQDATSSNNTLTVNGSGSTFNATSSTDSVIVGSSGSSNAIAISNGGRMSAGNSVYLGYGNSSANNSLTVNGTGSTLTATDNIMVGEAGDNNSLTASNGAQVSADAVRLGNQTSSNNNSVTITGAGTDLTVSGTLRSLVVGNYGSNNSFTLSSGASFNSTGTGGYTLLGNNAASSNNTVLVTGANTNWESSDKIIIGFLGNNNTFTIADGATVVSKPVVGIDKQNTIIGFGNTSNNNLIITGANSSFTSADEMVVGYLGEGAITIANGGNLSAGTIELAFQTGSKGVVNIGAFGGNTTGGTLSAADINFGSGNGTVNFNQSDNFTFAGNFTGGAGNYIYIKQLGSGTTTLTGTGSSAFADVIAEAGRLVFDGAVFDTGGKVFYIGETQSGATVELKNNAIVTAWETYIGSGENAADNTVLVGSNSTLKGNDDSSQLWVGYWNSLNNSLVISGGGRVEYGETYITETASKVKVTGTNSMLTGAEGQGSMIYLGAYIGANNTLDVENGGSVISTDTIIASDSASNNNTITINGTGSTYTASGTITVGDLGDNNTLSVINGGAVSTQNLILGNNATAANNTATVSGAGSTITATGNITVGKAGSGTLEILNGGNLSAGTIQIASQSGSTGTVNIGAFGGNTTGGTLSASNIAFGNGTGALNFNQSGNVTIAANLTGGGANSTVNQFGSGTTLLTGNSTYTGEVNIDAGTLATNSGNALGLADVSLNAGTFDLLSGLTIGSFVWNSSGILALDDVDQSQNNFLTVDGSFTLAGSTGNGSHVFDLRNFTLGVDPSKLVAFQSGITASDLNRFGIQNLSNYEFLIQNDALWVKLAALIVNGTTTIEQGSNLTYPLALFDPNSKLVIPGGSPSTRLNFAGNLTVTNNSTVMSNGSLAIANPYVIIVDQGSTLAGSGNVTASKVIVNGQLGDTTSNGGMTIHGDLDINTTGSYLWNLYANSANASRAGTDFSAPLTVNGTTTLTGNSTFSMYFDPAAVDYLNDFWDFNQSWVVMNGTAISGNLSTAFVANSAPGFSANTFRITNNGTTLLLSYLAPRIDDPTDISPTGDTNLPSYNSEPVKLVIDAPPTGTAVLANSNPSLTSIVLNSGSLISPTNTAIPENANVTVNDGTMGFQGDGVNYINGLLLTGGSLGTGGNTTVAVKSFLVTGGQLAGSGNATYWADNYLFQAVAPAKVDAKLDNLGTVAGFNSTALITTPITPGAASAPVVFDTNMLYSGNTTIAGGILQLGSGTSGDINLAAGSSVTLNNKDGYAGVLNYGSNANRSIMDNVVTGNGTVGQVGTGTLTITDDGATAFAGFTGNFAAANGKLAFDDVANLGGATGFNLSSNGTLQVDTGVTALSQNLSVTSGTGIVDNNTGGTLALNGTLAKTGSVLVLTGGNFEINGAIVGNSGSFNSDMVYDAATATINVPGVYLGPTFVQGGSTVTSGVANALPTDTVLHVGVATDGAVTNTFDLSTFDQTVAAITSAGSASNIITSTGGDLTVNGAQSTTYNGLITGPLALTRAGTGSTTLGGANTYSGGTTINAGRIITTSASALGTGAVVLNGGALQVMQTLQIASLNWASNSAVIALPNAYGTSAYLDVAGAITLGNPSGNTVDLTGTALDGTPTKLLGSGVTALSAASFAATGVNPAYDYELYTQGNDLWLRILSTEIEVSGPNSYTTINVNGAYTMSGVLTVAESGGYALQYGDQYLFLTATGGITGEYSSIAMADKFRGRLLLGNNNTTAKILVAPDTYTRVAITKNQKNAAKALDSFIPATSGDREAVSLALDLQTAAQYPYAFDQIAPGFYESLGDILIEQTYNQAQLLTQRLGSVRLGATGFQAIGMNQPIKYDKDGKSAADAKTASPIVESAIDTNWNSWVIANGEFSLSRGLAGVPNYNNNAGGFLVGADYRLSENFAAGVFAGYEYSYAKYDGGSSTRGNSALFGLYGTYTHEDGYYADAMVSGGYTGFQTRRSIEFSTIDRTASADPNSGQFSAALNLGKDFEIGKFTLGPIVGAQYTYVGIGGFTETGADSLDLALGQQNANSLRTNLGARLAYNWEVGSNITLIPEVRGFWMHEFLNNPHNISSALEGGSGPSFDYETSAPYRNSVFGGAGISANFANRWSASVFYNVNFGGDGYTNNIISTSLGLSF